MRAVGILLIDRNRQRCARRQFHVRCDVKRRGVLLASGTTDGPAGLGLVVDRTGRAKTALLVVGLAAGEFQSGGGIGRTWSTEEHGKCAEHEVAIPGAAGPLAGQAGVGERLELDGLRLHSSRNDALDRVRVLGKVARDGDRAVGSDRCRGAGHALEFGRHEGRRLLHGSGSGSRGRRRRRAGGRRGRRQELWGGRRHEFATGVRADEHRLAIRREGHAPDARLHRLRSFLLPLGVYVPELYGAVEAAGGQSRAVGREAGAGHPVFVA